MTSPTQTSTSGVTRRTHKTQCVHFPGLFPLWGGVGGGGGGGFRPPTPTHPKNTHTKQTVHTHLQNPGYATVNTSLALIKKQGLTGTALSMQIVPFGFEQSDHLQIKEVPGDHKLQHLLIKCQVSSQCQCQVHLCGKAVMKRSREISLHSDILKGVRKISSYAFKMRQRLSQLAGMNLYQTPPQCGAYIRPTITQ